MAIKVSGTTVIDDSYRLANTRETVSVISTPTTAVTNNTYVLTAAVALTLPASPNVGDWIKVCDVSGSLLSVIVRNGSNIMGLAENMSIDTSNANFKLTYVDATRGWVLV